MEQDHRHGDRLWPRMRPWAAASLAGSLATILMSIAEAAHPNIIRDLYVHVLRDWWPSGISFRGSHIRVGGPILAYTVVGLSLSFRNNTENAPLRDDVAEFILTKAFSGVYLVPPMALMFAMHARTGPGALFGPLPGTDGFDTRFFFRAMEDVCLLPLQATASGLLAYCVNRKPVGLVAAGFGAVAALLLSFAVSAPGLSAAKLFPPEIVLMCP